MRNYAKLLRATLTVLLMLVAMAGVTVAGQYEDAFGAYRRQDYATALRLFRSLSDQGSVEAKFYLGMMYDRGQGVPQSDVEAARWFRMAAEQGDVTSQSTLGSIYLFGEEGVPQNYAEAKRWSLKAALHGDAHAQRTLAKIYKNGYGVPQNYILAYMWFTVSVHDPEYEGSSKRGPRQNRAGYGPFTDRRSADIGAALPAIPLYGLQSSIAGTSVSRHPSIDCQVLTSRR
jgi:Sel1 repeat